MLQRRSVSIGYLHHKLTEGIVFCHSTQKSGCGTIPSPDLPALIHYALIPRDAHSSVTKANFSVIF